MLLTDKFTFIHMPKTGGTFVTAALERLHRIPRTPLGRRFFQVASLLGVKPALTRRYGKLLYADPKHGTCHDIPQPHARKPILSCVRGPYEWYVSQFEFGWWKHSSDFPVDDQPTPAGWAIEKALPSFISDHPEFPQVSFDAFMKLCAAAAREFNEDSGTNFGLYTHSFLRFFYKDPEDVLRDLHGRRTAADFTAGRFDVHFLRTERLNADLRVALAGLGYRDEDLAFIEAMGKVLPMGIGRRDDQHWQSYYTPELAASVRAADDPLFRMFPVYDVKP